MSDLIPVDKAKAAIQADGRVIIVDSSKCLGGGEYPCPGCGNCDRLVPWPED